MAKARIRMFIIINYETQISTIDRFILEFNKEMDVFVFNNQSQYLTYDTSIDTQLTQLQFEMGHLEFKYETINNCVKSKSILLDKIILETEKYYFY